MRHWRTLGVAATVCAFVFSATPALAHEFTASKHGKLTGRATEESEEAGPESQMFKFGPFHIYCQKAMAKGEVEAGVTSTFAASIKMSKCLTEASFIGVSISNSESRPTSRPRWRSNTTRMGSSKPGRKPKKSKARLCLRVEKPNW